MANNRKYTQEERDFIKRFAPGHTGAEIREEFLKRFGGKVAKSFPASYANHHREINIRRPARPVGTERRRKKYIQVKIANNYKDEEGNWKYKHHIVYEQHYGKIPDDHVVIFLDGDTTNFDPANLKAVSKGTHAKLNQNKLRFDDPDLTRTGVNVAELLMIEGRLR